MGPAIILCGVDFILDIEMLVQLRCSLPLALKLGVQLAETERHLERLLADEAAIRITSCTLPLYWPWQLGRLDRAMARRSPRRHE
jgi:hypothetical protein